MCRYRSNKRNGQVTMATGEAETIQPNEKEKKDIDGGESEKSLVREVVETIVLALILAFALRTFVVQAFYIPSGSMENTLLPGDMILVNKFIYYFTDIKRGDIIVFKYPNDPSKDYIKRVVGLPGDSLELKNGDVYVNDKLYEEKYTKDKAADDMILHAHIEKGEGNSIVSVAAQTKITVPAGKYFVMGDNRNNSQDSRFWGFLSYSGLKGKALVIYWPLSRIGIIR